MIRKLRKLNDEKKHHTKIGKRKQELKKGTRSAFAMSICSLILVSSGSLDSGIYVLGSSMSFSCSKKCEKNSVYEDIKKLRFVRAENLR